MYFNRRRVGFRGNVRGRGFFARTVIASTRRIHNLDRGVAFIPRADPPKINQSPWSPYTLALYMEGAGVNPVKIGVNVVTNNLQLELGLYYEDANAQRYFAPICFRVLEAKVWNLSRGPVKTCFFSLVGEEFTSVQEDVPSVINYARVGFRWPKAHQVSVFSKGRGNDDDIINVYVPNSNKFLVHLSLLWRPLKNQQYVPSSFVVADSSLASEFLTLSIT